MTDVLLIVDQPDGDAALLEEVERRRPDRVTVLVEQDGSTDGTGHERRRLSRLTRLQAAIERRTGAIVVGLAASREQLAGWRFDRIIGGSGVPPALHT